MQTTTITKDNIIETFNNNLTSDKSVIDLINDVENIILNNHSNAIVDNQHNIKDVLSTYIIDTIKSVVEKRKKHNEYIKKYYADNKDKCKEITNRYYINNVAKIKNASQKYYNENKEKVNERQKQYYNNKKNKDNNTT
jgi:hypothetical protein